MTPMQYSSLSRTYQSACMYSSLVSYNSWKNIKMPTIDDSLSEVSGRQSMPSPFQLPRIIIWLLVESAPRPMCTSNITPMIPKIVHIPISYQDSATLNKNTKVHMQHSRGDTFLGYPLCRSQALDRISPFENQDIFFSSDVSRPPMDLKKRILLDLSHVCWCAILREDYSDVNW